MSDDQPTLPYPRPSDDHPTLVIPPEPSGPARRRRRWPWGVAILIVVLVVLVVAAELLARSILPGIVRGIIVDELALPADQQLDVETEGLLLPQLISGRLDELHLSTDAVTLSGITGAVAVTASGVAIDGSAIADAHGTLRIDEGELTALVSSTDVPIDEIRFDEPDVVASGGIEIFGFPVPIALTATPGAEEGDLVLTPVSVDVNGFEVDLSALGDRFGGVGDALSGPQRICIADQLPAGLTITDVAVAGAELVIDIDVDGGIISDAVLQANGTCG